MLRGVEVKTRVRERRMDFESSKKNYEFVERRLKGHFRLEKIRM